MGMQNGMQSGSQGNGAQSTGRDYRDDLRELLDRAHSERGLTRYRLCKQMGIDSGTLSNVLAKRRHFSLEKLEQILGLLGYRLSFTQGEAGANGATAPGASNGGRAM
jgi:transcriptional regulator with XRE-family HTH domain